MKISIALLVLVLFVVSCERVHEEKKKIINNPEASEERNDRQFNEAMDNITQKLNLPTLKKGVDSFELRIWYPLHSSKTNIITARYIYSQWCISETIVWQKYPESSIKRNDTTNHMTDVIIDSTKSTNLIYKVDKDKFLDTLLNTYIFHLPKREEFNGSTSHCYDGSRITFEIAQKDKYNRLAYDIPCEVLNKIKIHKKMRDLIDFLNRYIDKK